MKTLGGRTRRWMGQFMARWAADRRLRLLLTMQLAVCLPAAGLIYLNFYHLKSFERDQVLEAAIHRDFQQMLVIAEKRINERIDALAEEARAAFPTSEATNARRADVLDALLATRPWVAHVFLFDRDHGLVVRSQPGRLSDSAFLEDRARFASFLESRLFPELKDFVGDMRKKGRNINVVTERTADIAPRSLFATTAYLAVSNTSESPDMLGGIRFDGDYLTHAFFPEALNELVAYGLGQETATPLAMSVTLASPLPNHASLTSAASRVEPILAASSGWGAGAAEVSRNFGTGFRGLALGIKFQGASAAALGQSWAWRAFLTLAAVSFLLVGGLALAFRGVGKELAFARLQSDFVSNVSHELRTPLSLIRLHAETLELGRVKTADRILEYYATIRIESERLTALLDNILDFSRIEAGKKEYDFRLEDLGELVRSTIETYRAQIDAHGFELSVGIEPDLPLVRVDRESIARSLINLVNNALKYSDRDRFLGVRVYRSGNRVRLEVADRGIGIARSEHAKIFEKFYRVGDPLVHNTKGSGLGLSLVRHIADAHHGDIHVDSSPVRGSTFTLSLPVSPRDASDGTAQRGVRNEKDV